MVGKRVLVVGLGRFGGGVGVTRWLVGQGADVTVVDQADHSALESSLDALSGLDVTVHVGDNDPRHLDGVDLVVINPAVNKAKSPLFRELVRRQIPWTTEINLFCRVCPATVIGVTGSYGKSTTCAMLAEALETARTGGDVSFTAVHLGGNIGRSLLNDLPSIQPSDLVVLELSNAQLDDLPRIAWAPPVAVITNIQPHHLDRYPDFGAYVEAKVNIVRDPLGRSRVITGPLEPAVMQKVRDALAPRLERLDVIGSLPDDLPLRIPGAHNRMNAACALAVCRHFGLDETVARGSVAAFRGLPHRLEFVRSVNGTDYFNDSKSTAHATTVAALRCFDRPVIAILGGQRKPEPEESTLIETIRQRCRAVLCIGASGPDVARAVRAADGTRRDAPPGPEVAELPTLDAAVSKAHRTARPGEAVLFSPAAPSFDAYANFAERGAHFIRLVNALE